eukprot:1141997-Pelagomonas_calceolata.AAC.13
MMGYRRECVPFNSMAFRSNIKSLLSCSPLGDWGHPLPSKPFAVVPQIRYKSCMGILEALSVLFERILVAHPTDTCADQQDSSISARCKSAFST